jgi:hypothetical protein
MIDLPSTASTVEVVWTALAVPGLALSVYNAIGAYRDIHYHWRDGLRPVGWVGLAKVTIVLAMCLLVLLTGVVAMLVPEPLRPSLQDAGDFIATCLLIMDALTLALAIAFFWERRYVVPHVHILRERV